MKSSVWVFAIVCSLIIHSAQTQNNEELFLQGNQAYVQGDFLQAINLYNAIENKGAIVWYNLGNSWYRIENYVQALLCWAKANKYGAAAIRSAVAHNAQRAHEHLGITDDRTPLQFIGAKIESALMRIPVFVLQVLFLTALYVFVFCYIFLGRKQNVLLLFLLMVFLGFLLLFVMHVNNRQHALIVQPKTTIYAGMDKQFSQVGTLNAGQEIILLEQKENGWSKIACGLVRGWVNSESLETI